MAWRGAGAGIMVQRDGAFLHWRFDAGCRLFLAQATHGPVGGYAAVRLITRAGLKLGMLLDCVTAGRGQCGTVARGCAGLVAGAGCLGRAGIFCAIQCAVASSPRRRVCLLPGLLVPRDYPVCASVRPDDPHSAELLNPAHWYMSLADSDLA